MKQIIWDGARLCEPHEGHAYLAQTMDFPAYYGANLDALYDCLTEICDDTEIVLTRRQPADDTYLLFETVARDAAEENPHLQLRRA